jgi:antitoxin MazE
LCQPSQGSIVLRRPTSPREGWADAARRIAGQHDDALIWPEFGNEADSNLKW